ncbi:MAG: tetratricopeptide repeat protein [Chitinispirillaceae bacterium]|nr:tetratricopeptide repeat protein [Chitinispirillaceae bacterium]
MAKFTRLYFIEVLVVFFSLQVYAETPEHLFLSDHVEKALHEQHHFIKLLQPPQNRIKPSELVQEEVSLLMNRLEALDDSYHESCWYYYYMGLLASEINRENNFKLSLSKAEHKPGNLWLLYIAFSSDGFTGWDEQALNSLEKELLILGAEQSTIISRLMVHYAVLEASNGRTQNAEDIFTRARRFGSDDNFSFYLASWKFFPQILLKMPHVFQTYGYSFFTSLQTHLKTLSFTHGIIRSFLFLTLLSLAITFLIKYLPFVLHKLIDSFPFSIPYTVKVFFVIIAYMSLISFGILPFFWLSSVLIYKHLSKNEKALYTVAFIIMCLIPLDVHIQSFLLRATNPEGILNVYSRSVHEGYSERAYASTVLSISKDPDNHLLHLSAANYSLKSGNFSAAVSHVEKALSLRSDDPVVLTTAGNIFFLKNDIERALKIYKKALEANPDYPEALYNAGQCLLRKLQTVDAMEMINKAVKKSSDRLNAFIKTNDMFFSDSVPLLRRIIFADYTPEVFWSSTAFKSIYNPASVSSYWGMAFLGIPPWWSFVISLCVLVLIIFRQIQSSSKRPLREFFECRYCGQILCRSCKDGSLCSRCSDAVKFVHNEYALDKLHTRIAAKSHLTRNISCYFADIVFPGTGYILRGELFNLKTGNLLIITSFFYIMYYMFFFSEKAYVHFHFLHLTVLIPSVGYSLYFLFKYARLIFKEISSYTHSLEV